MSIKLKVLLTLASIAILVPAAATSAAADSAPPTPVDQVSSTQQYGADDANTCGAGDINCTDATCVNPGNPNGYCWYSGYQFGYRTVCVEMVGGQYWAQSTAVTTTQRVAQLWAIEGVRIYARNTTGGCAGSGFGDSQTVAIEGYSADDGHCGYTVPLNYGYHSLGKIKIRANMHADTATNFYATACRSGENWHGFIGHEFGHALGLSHYAGGIMSVGIPVLSDTNKAMIANLYGDNACGDPVWVYCV